MKRITGYSLACPCTGEDCGGLLFCTEKIGEKDGTDVTRDCYRLFINEEEAFKEAKMIFQMSGQVVPVVKVLMLVGKTE